LTITGKPKEINLDRHFFLPALKFGLSELAILDELSPMVCSREGKRMVIMPVRPPASTPPTEKPKEPIPDEPKPTSAANPPSTEVKSEAEERKSEVSKATSTTTETPATVDSPFKLAMNQVDAIREALKQVLRELASVTDTLKLAEKEKKATDKEIEQFREKLREIQGIRI
jgi:hypothetical protein